MPFCFCNAFKLPTLTMATYQQQLSPSASTPSRPLRPESSGDFENISLNDDNISSRRSPGRRVSSTSQLVTTPSRPLYVNNSTPSPSSLTVPLSRPGVSRKNSQSEGRNLLSSPNTSPNMGSGEFTRKTLPPTPRSSSFANIGRYSAYSQPSLNGSLTNLHAPPSPSFSPSQLSTPPSGTRRQASLSDISLPRHHRVADGSGVRSERTSPNRVYGSDSSSPINRRASADDGFALPIRRPQDSRRLSQASLSKSPSASIDNGSERSGDDIDVPEDIIFWNVPLTPEVKIGSGARTPTPGSMPSPERSRENSSRGYFETDMSPSRQRQGSSWNHAMDHLSEEAKDLTVALEDYRGRLKTTTRQQMLDKFREQKGVPVPSRPLPEQVKQKAEAEAKELSAEEIASSSVTRPSHLPRKSKTEEEKHLKEYQKMMLKSQQQGMYSMIYVLFFFFFMAHLMISSTEKRKKEKKLLELKEHMKKQRDDFAYWDNTIINNPLSSVSEPRSQDVIWRSGIPLRYRERMWPLLVGNRLEIKPEQYDEIVMGINATETKEYEMIIEDVALVYPETKLFQSSGPLRGALLDILIAFSNYKKEISYKTGMHVCTLCCTFT